MSPRTKPTWWERGLRWAVVRFGAATAVMVLTVLAALRWQHKRPARPREEPPLPAPPASGMSPENVVQAADDRDTIGSGLPVPATQAALELQEENRFETAVFVRSMLILGTIAIALTARTLFL